MSKYLFGGTMLAAAALVTSTAAETSESTALLRTALDFVSRASSTSEVLTLNLTNMLILLFLKAIIFAFTLFSFGSAASARSADFGVTPSIGKTDLTGGMCFMMYTAGDDAKLTCVQRSACEDPTTAQEYLTAAKMWYKIHKILKVVPFQPKYFEIMRALETARNHSVSGGDCSVYQW